MNRSSYAACLPLSLTLINVVFVQVHERHLDTDVLLAILKKTLPSLPNLTVVLMSGKY